MQTTVYKFFVELFPQIHAISANRSIENQRNKFTSKEMHLSNGVTIADDDAKDAEHLVEQDDSVRETVSDKAKAGLFIIGIAVVSMVNFLNFEHTAHLSASQRLLLAFGFLQLIFSTYCLVAAMFPKQWCGIYWSSLVNLSEDNSFEPIKLNKNERYAQQIISTRMNEFETLKLANLVTAGYKGVRNSIIVLFGFFIWMQFAPSAQTGTEKPTTGLPIERFLIEKKTEIRRIVVPQRGSVVVVDPLARQVETQINAGLIVYFADGSTMPIKAIESQEIINSGMLPKNGLQIEFDTQRP